MSDNYLDTEVQRCLLTNNDGRRQIVRNLLGLDSSSPIYAIYDHLRSKTYLESICEGKTEVDELHGSTLEAIDHLAEPPHVNPGHLHIDLFEDVRDEGIARQERRWEAEILAHEGMLDRTTGPWGPLYAAIASIGYGFERVAVRIPCAYLSSRKYTSARRHLLEQGLIERVAYVRRPLSAPSHERDCYLIVSEANDTIAFSYVSDDGRNDSGSQPFTIAKVPPEHLLLDPEAGMSMFNAKIAQARIDGRMRVGDIAEILSSAGSAVRRNGGLSEDSRLPIRYISIVDFEHGALKPRGKYCKKHDTFELEKYELKPGDILVARNATAGSVQIVPHEVGDNLKPLIASENVLVLRPNKGKIHPYVLYCYLAFGEGKAFINDCREAAATGSIPPRHLADIPAPVVTEADQANAALLYSEYQDALKDYDEVLHRISDIEEKSKHVARMIHLHTGRGYRNLE
ncbi:MAG: restriction endonuclease subunit S [Coriobacteriaceae bacterium]|nr:restriction endonuclease subunit S [Coriobacteriaceae bacterium]